MSSTTLGWTCAQCTFQHHAPGDRCSMCHQLRVTPKHMYDFLNGIPIPKECQTDPLFARVPGKKVPKDNEHRDVENRPPTLSQKNNFNNNKVISNPYFTKVKTQGQLINGNQANSEQMRGDKVLPVTVTGPSSVVRGFESTTNTLSEEEHRRPIPSKSSDICPIFQPRANLIRPASRPEQNEISFSPGPVPLDLISSKEWIFPVDDDFPKRDYQLEISEAAIHQNTLVSLPTGLGKTLIAAVVMYNYCRFFPRGKILFLAPTLPLVNQQVQACFNIMGIPEKDTAVLTGKINASRRAELWNEKRVFYCTPQTIQFDLEASRCNPDNFVCVVLDEAHRATGNHSYVTIVKKLFESNAKFRLLGLSATPGKTIKDIQAVIDILRISKIEARTEADSSIAKYIHDRAVEEVMVPNVSVAKDVERMLNDLLLVQLDRLRSRGALSGNLDYQYITSHQLRKIQERLPDTSLSGIFHIATTLCDLRTKVHVNGLACVHSVMKRLLSTRHMGPMAPFLRSEEFVKVWNVVENGKDAVANNPKLMKLREILTEHFERDRAIGRSSRSIVFSQFRDSVSEIVSTLQSCSPLIRPRHFIGQGNRTKGSEGQLQGMNQAEQQEVIRQFRSDVYNVLVCTSIGEEGLDIGEVDLIVNYDVVRSAIRSIQRVGRTGRKRDGRVVVLVSEGQEKKSYDSSKHSVGTLARALKSNKFKVNLGEPLFPTKPVVREKKMAVADSFRSSQVEGHEGGKKRGRDTSGLDDRTESVVSSEWKLSTSQKEYISRITPESIMSGYLAGENMPRDLSRRFLTGRRLSFARKSNRFISRGRSSLMLHRIESSHSCTDDIGEHNSRSLPSTVPSDFKYKNFPLNQLLETEAHVDFHKPLNSIQKSENPILATTDGEESERDETSLSSSNCTKRPKLIACNPYHGSLESKLSSRSTPLATPLLDSSEPVAPRRQIKRNPYASLAKATLQNPSSTLNGTDLKVMQTTCEFNPLHLTGQIEQIFAVDKPDSAGDKPTTLHTTRTNTNMDPYRSEGPSLDKLSIKEVESGGTFTQTKGQMVMETKSSNLLRQRCPVENEVNECTSLQTTGGSHVPNQLQDQIEKMTKVQVECPVSIAGISELDDEFILPSQSDCSSSSDDDSDRGGAGLIKIPVPSTEVPEFSLPSPASSCSDSSTDEIPETRKRSGNASAQKSLFCGPALESEEFVIADSKLQTSNSPDEEVVFRRRNKYAKRRAIVDATPCADEASPSGDVSSDNIGKIPEPSTAIPEFCLPSPASSCSDSSTDEAAETRKRSGNHGKQKPLFCGPADYLQTSSTPDDAVFLRRGNKYAKRRAIVDATQCADDASVQDHLAQEPLKDTPPLRDLTNTQETQTPSSESPMDDIVCAICFSGDSPDEDPIVLCDGYGQDKACNVAVHTTCYSIPATFRDDDDWRCDPCDFRHKGHGKQSITCLSCGTSEGALKRVDGNIFHHIKCSLTEPSAPSHTSEYTKEDHGKKLDSFHQKKMAQRRAVRKFFDEEAGIDSDEDMDGDLSEDEEVEAIEEEEANISGFINDTSQLGYTQDDLDRIGLDASVTIIHQELDNMRTRAQQFKTPILNRRMRDSKHRESLGSADSAKGLGNMHFIRSVLEHHRQGGNVDEIEEHYNQLEAEASSPEEGISQNAEPATKQVIYYESSDAEED